MTDSAPCIHRHAIWRVPTTVCQHAPVDVVVFVVVVVVFRPTTHTPTSKTTDATTSTNGVLTSTTAPPTQREVPESRKLARCGSRRALRFGTADSAFLVVYWPTHRWTWRETCDYIKCFLQAQQHAICKMESVVVLHSLFPMCA